MALGEAVARLPANNYKMGPVFADLFRSVILYCLLLSV